MDDCDSVKVRRQVTVGAICSEGRKISNPSGGRATVIPKDQIGFCGGYVGLATVMRRGDRPGLTRMSERRSESSIVTSSAALQLLEGNQYQRYELFFRQRHGYVLKAHRVCHRQIETLDSVGQDVIFRVIVFRPPIWRSLPERGPNPQKPSPQPCPHTSNRPPRGRPADNARRRPCATRWKGRRPCHHISLRVLATVWIVLKFGFSSMVMYIIPT